MQVKLLRVLQEKRFVCVDGNEAIECSARIIASPTAISRHDP